MRDYDPTLGRYIQADPLGLVDGASVYGYALQNPGRYVDPRGECVGLALLACAAGAGLTNAAIGYVIEMNWGDGCYTWHDFTRDFAIGAALSPLSNWKHAASLAGAAHAAKGVTAGATAGSTAGAAAAKGITNPSIPKGVLPPIPSGMTPSQFGDELIQMGKKAEGAINRMKEIGPDAVNQMRQGGLTEDMAAGWRDFYRNEFARNANNSTAKSRTDLFAEIFKYF